MTSRLKERYTAEIVPALQRARKLNADGHAVLLEFITSEEIEFSHRRAF